MRKKSDFSGWFFERMYRYRNKLSVFLFNGFIHFICRLKGVQAGEGTIFNGLPLLRRYENSRIIFGNNCRFNSSRNSVRVGLNSPCAFVTLNYDAEILIGKNSGATGVLIAAAESIKIGNNVTIGSNTTIIDNDFHHPDPGKRGQEKYPTRPIIIEDNVFIGFNCMILKGVTIGENSIIGANSVVISSLPKNSVAIGNPCKLVMRRSFS